MQEALQKVRATAEHQIRWHLVGHLQSNKARKAASAFHCVHSIDGPDLMQQMDLGAVEAGTTPELLVQVDLAGESTKFGAPEATVPALFEAARSLRAARWSA